MKKKNRRKSAPQFLLDIYKKLKLANEDGEENGDQPRVKRDVIENEIYLSPADQFAIDESDIIMTFLNKSESNTFLLLFCISIFATFPLVDHHVPEKRHEHGRRLWFDTHEIAEDLSLMMAELRLYQNPMFAKSADDKPLTINVFMVESRDDNNHEVLKLLSSMNTTTHANGWLELNVTYAMHHWTVEKNDNLGLIIKASLNERPEKEIRLDEFGLVTSKGDEEFQPFMVGYFTGQEVSMFLILLNLTN